MFSILLTKYTETVSQNEWAYPSTAPAWIPPGRAWLDPSQDCFPLLCKHQTPWPAPTGSARATPAEGRCTILHLRAPDGLNQSLVKTIQRGQKPCRGEARGGRETKARQSPPAADCQTFPAGRQVASAVIDLYLPFCLLSTSLLISKCPWKDLNNKSLLKLIFRNLFAKWHWAVGGQAWAPQPLTPPPAAPPTGLLLLVHWKAAPLPEANTCPPGWSVSFSAWKAGRRAFWSLSGTFRMEFQYPPPTF